MQRDNVVADLRYLSMSLSSIYLSIHYTSGLIIKILQCQLIYDSIVGEDSHCSSICQTVNDNKLPMPWSSAQDALSVQLMDYQCVCKFFF